MCNLLKAGHTEESVHSLQAEILSSFVFCSAISKGLWTQDKNQSSKAIVEGIIV